LWLRFGSAISDIPENGKVKEAMRVFDFSFSGEQNFCATEKN
jgi:hypothetical protein